jgi:hypothetical protein
LFYRAFRTQTNLRKITSFKMHLSPYSYPHKINQVHNTASKNEAKNGLKIDFILGLNWRLYF